MTHRSDDELIAKTHNIARYFTEVRQVAWVLLVATMILGIYSYSRMPKRKDPFIKVRSAVAVCAWPGASPESMEELVTRKIEERVAQSGDVDKIESASRSGISVITVTLREDIGYGDVGKAFDDIDLRLKSINDLPAGASPIEFQKDFGDTAALMLTVASPKVRDVELELRAGAISKVIAKARADRAPSSRPDELRTATVLNFPASLSLDPLRRVLRLFADFAQQHGARDVEILDGPGFLGVDGLLPGNEDAWRLLVGQFLSEKVRASRFHPDVWKPIFLTDTSHTLAELTLVAGDAYSYRALDDFTDTIAKQLRRVPSVSKVTRAGVIGERVYLDYSQERFAALGVGQSLLRDAIGAQNVQVPGGVLEADGRNLTIDPSGSYKSETEIGGTLLTTSASGSPVYVRDVVDVFRDYESPPSYLNFHTRRDASGVMRTNRAITLAVQMRTDEQVEHFSREVDTALADVTRTLPEDLIVARTSDQPRQVEEKIGLFMMTMYEAIAIIVFVGLVGFREWRSATLLALSIPLTLAMTFVFMAALGIDIQQMSIAALILALGLLVDDPVVAGDAIKNELDRGRPRQIAAWLGPTKLATAILFATITNIVAYLPFLLMRGDVGRFVYSLPIVLTCSLVASRLVSMTFIPLLGHALLRGRKETEGAPSKTMAAYRGVVGWAIDRRYVALGASLLVLFVGVFAGTRLKSSFFPKDLSTLCYVDLFLPEDSSISASTDVAMQADHVIRDVLEQYGKEHKKGANVLESITTFVGGGAPRFWYSLAPQQRQLNYAQLVIEVTDERDTAALIGPLQRALTSQVPGARIDVRQLENGKPVPYPVEVRFSGSDIPTLRSLSERAQDIMRQANFAERVRDDWGSNSFRVKLEIDPVRAELAGVSNQDVAASSAAGFSGAPLNFLHDGNRLIPIVARLRPEERGSLGDIKDLYVLSTRGAQKVPLGQVSNVKFSFATEKIQRRNQVRTISASCFPSEHHLPSEVLKQIRSKLLALSTTLPPGYTMEIGGSDENVRKVASDAAIVAVVSILGILLTLVIQFRDAVKPLIVFAAIPYGISGALMAIAAMGAPFGFTAIVGVISLVGVIVSHIIVLFDYLEEAEQRGEPLRQALLDAGTKRLRPVLITVGATVLGLIPLAIHGGPLWEPLCYAQVGGLTLATGITLILVPVLYAIFVNDLGWVHWGAATQKGGTLVMPKAGKVPLVARTALVPRAAQKGGTAVFPGRTEDAATELMPAREEREDPTSGK